MTAANEQRGDFYARGRLYGRRMRRPNRGNGGCYAYERSALRGPLLGCASRFSQSPGAPTGRPNRRSIRLTDYDYTQPGAYFITAVTQGRGCLFGAVVDGVMRLNAYGKVVRACWLEIPRHFANVELDEFVVMPNHVHGIIFLVEDAAGASGGAMPQRPPPQPGPPSRSVGAIVGSFKSAVTRRINRHRNSPGTPVWQRNYFEHVVRNEESLHRIRNYIRSNPGRWDLDRENPGRSHSHSPLAAA